MSARPKAVAIAGPNGAGKSTLAPFLLRDTYGLLQFVNADSIALGLSAFDPASVSFDAGRIMLARLRSLAASREDFAFETTLASRSYARWLTMLKRQGYEFHLIYLWLNSVELAVQRVRERVRLGGHDVPESVVRRRYERGARNFFRLYRALADSWGVYDNSGAGEPTQVAVGAGGDTAEVFQSDPWRRFVEVAKWRPSGASENL
jgi:predicted ABC-type ATPase